MKLKSVSANKIGSYPWVPFDELWVELEANKSSGCIYAPFNSVRGGAFIAVYGTEGIMKVNLHNNTLIKLKQSPAIRLSCQVDSLQQVSQLFLSAARDAALKLSGRWVDGHEACLRAFVHSVLNAKAPLVTLEEACANMEILKEVCRTLELAS